MAPSLAAFFSGGPGDPVGWDAQLTPLTSIDVRHAVAPPCATTPCGWGYLKGAPAHQTSSQKHVESRGEAFVVSFTVFAVGIADRISLIAATEVGGIRIPKKGSEAPSKRGTRGDWPKGCSSLDNGGSSAWSSPSGRHRILRSSRSMISSAFSSYRLQFVVVAFFP